MTLQNSIHLLTKNANLKMFGCEGDYLKFVYDSSIIWFKLPTFNENLSQENADPVVSLCFGNLSF